MKFRDWLGGLAHASGRFRRSGLAADERVRAGFAHQRAGEYVKARECYLAILSEHPDQPAALYLLGEIACMDGHYEEAIELISRAIRSDGTVGAFHYRLGVALQAVGEVARARLSYEQAVKLEPGHAEAHNNLGCVLEAQGHLDRATAAYRRAADCDPGLAQAQHNLANALCARGEYAEAARRFHSALALHPDHARSHYGLGRALASQGERDAAIESYRQALALEPRFFEAARELAIAWFERGDPEQAETCSRCALQIDPDSAEIHLHLGNVLRQQRRFDEALECCLRAVALDPGMARAHNNLGNAYQDLGRSPEAIAAFRKALELDPALAEAHFNLGIAVHQGGEVGQASVHYRAALALDQDLADAHLNLGYALEQLGDPRTAIRHYRRAIAAEPNLAEAHFNLALQLLLTGDFAQGWEEYEWRWQLPGLAGANPHRGNPHWDGAEVAGKTVLLYAEQGFGDAIQFLRYAPQVARRGAKVVVQCAPELKTLFGCAPGIPAVVSNAEPVPECDLCCSLLSLPRIFKTSLDGIPAPHPYLRADAGKTRVWKERLAADGTALKVGLVWASQTANKIARLKSMPLDLFAPLGAIADVVFYSLQKGAAAGEAARAPRGMRIVDPSAQLGDFSDTAALIENLDLVISVDTAVAHLAGAMGRRVWTLTHFPPDWRWLLERADSPWYPTMRLFRKQRMRDWSSVVGPLAEALKQFADAR